MTKAFAVRCVAAASLLQTLPAGGAPGVHRVPLIATDTAGKTVFGLPNGSRVTLGSDGFGTRTNASGTKSQPIHIVRPTMKTAFERSPGPSNLAVAVHWSDRFANSDVRLYLSARDACSYVRTRNSGRSVYANSVDVWT